MKSEIVTDGEQTLEVILGVRGCNRAMGNEEQQSHAEGKAYCGLSRSFRDK